MIQSVTIDIISNEAMTFLRNMELQRLIRVNQSVTKKRTDWSKYKGSMTKQPIHEVEQQLKELRNSWE